MIKQIAIIVTDAENIPHVNGGKTIFTPYDQKIPDIPNTKVVKIPSYIFLGEDLANVFADTVRLPDTDDYRNILEYVYFSHLVAFFIAQENYDEVIFEDNDLRDQILKQFNNKERYAAKSSLI